MARARILDDSEEKTAAERQAEELADLNLEEGGELFRAIEEMRSTVGAEVIVTRTAPADKAGFCDKIPVGEFDLLGLKARFGAGTYRLRVNGPKGFLPGGGTLKIAPPTERATDARTGGDFFTYLEFMEKQNAERRERSNRLLELGIPALGTIIAAMMNRPAGTDVAALVTALKPAPGPTLADLSTAMVNMQQLTGGAKAGSDPIDTVLRVFEAAKDLGGEGSSGKAGSSNWIDIIRDLIREAPNVAGPVLQGLAARAGMRGGAPPATPVTANTAPPRVAPAAIASVSAEAPSAVPAAPVSVGPAEVPSGDDGMNVLQMAKPMIVQKLKKIAKWASENRNPLTYAELFIDEEIPANFANYVPQAQAVEYLQHPQWFEKVCEWEPLLAPHREWCDEFRGELLALITLPDGPTEETAEPAPTFHDVGGTTGIDAAS